MSTAGQDRLFVPLTAQAFEWWQKGKTHELRLDAPRWSPKHVYQGRRAELSRGYSGPSLWGTIGRVARGGFYRLLLDRIIHPCNIVPEPATIVLNTGTILGPGRLIPTIEDAIGLRQGSPDGVVAFEVVLDEGQGVGE